MFLPDGLAGVRTICFSLFAAPRPVGPDPMTRTSTLLDLGQHGIQCSNCVEAVTYISLPLALLRLRWWVLGPLASLEGVLGMVKRCLWYNRDVYYAPRTVQWRCEERGVVVVVMVAAGARRQASIIIITVVLLSMQARYRPPLVLAPSHSHFRRAPKPHSPSTIPPSAAHRCMNRVRVLHFFHA